MITILPFILEIIQKNQCKIAKNRYHKNLIDNNIHDARKYWRAVNAVINPKPSTCSFSLIDQTNKTPIASAEISEYINTYFATIGERLGQNQNTPWLFDGVLYTHTQSCTLPLH